MLHTQEGDDKRLLARHQHRLSVLAVILISFAVRLFRLGATSLWYDETVSVSLATQSIPKLIAHTAGDIHPPGYYLLLHVWRYLAQPTQWSGFEFLYAWPSLWCGVLIATLLYTLARRLYCRAVALLTLCLAAIHPFQVWYSQEVRMYTLGAALGLLALWALLRFLTAQRSVRWLSVYVVIATLGLYTLYYYLFVLAALNLLALVCLGRRRATWPRLWQWLGAQLGVLALWSPWLPTFWRQIMEPPVPPWRPAWQGWQDLLYATGESLSALVIGQGAPANFTWLWALLALAATALIWYVNPRPAMVTATSQFDGIKPAHHQRNTQVYAPFVVPIYVFAPMLLLYGVSLAVTPLYHVRYLFLYTPPFIIMLAGALWTVRSWGRPLFAAVLLGLVLADFWSLREVWWGPANQRDDHRSTVAYLADQWRPGDRILVNAGWVYTVLETYWPTEIHDALAAAPPKLAPAVRLVDLLPAQLDENQGFQLLEVTPQLVRTGSVAGPISLGWGAAEADFFAISEADTYAALTVLANGARRIWHYRLYDTVSDPNGSIRLWLETHATLRSERPIAGRDFGLLQLYEIIPADRSLTVQTDYTPRDEIFGDAVQLAGVAIPAQIHAGGYLYVMTRWQARPALKEQASDLSLSLRLYDQQGNLLAQRDEGGAIAAAWWQAGAHYDLPLALPVPLAAAPGEYRVALVVYLQQTGQPLPRAALLADTSEDAQMANLAMISVVPPLQTP
jgi:uncharacterized membrane protein